MILSGCMGIRSRDFSNKLMKIIRRKTRVVRIKDIRIGGGNPVAVQSMTKVKTSDHEKVIRQIKALQAAGCEMVRVAVEDRSDAAALRIIKKNINIPLVADIHFDWRLALLAVEAGADKIRLNPGNIHKKQQIADVVSALKAARIPLRIGVNSGSVRGLRHGKKSIADDLTKSALDYIKKIEKLKFHDIVVSLKAADVLDTLEAYRKISRLCDYPLHLGLTATGSPSAGAVKSSVLLGILLSEGIGDTIRVSLTADPLQEIKVARSILEALRLRCFGPEVISCPTCGRCAVDLAGVVSQLEDRIANSARNLSHKAVKLAVMGCVVNGPGEAAQADFGVAFGKKDGLFFRKGKPVKKVAFADCVNLLLKEMGVKG